MTPEFFEWAAKWGVSDAALFDLRCRYLPDIPPPPPQDGYSEAAVQARVRLKGSSQGMLLMRNNVGVLKDDRGVPVRFGLANDSHAMNENIKSSDLIGIRSLYIKPEHVGKKLGIFVALECKEGGWKYSGKGREVAQARFMSLIKSYGGEARFINSEDQL